MGRAPAEDGVGSRSYDNPNSICSQTRRDVRHVWSRVGVRSLLRPLDGRRVGRAGRVFRRRALHRDGEPGPVQLPVAIVADREADDHIDELRIYFSTWALTRRRANRRRYHSPT